MRTNPTLRKEITEPERARASDSNAEEYPSPCAQTALGRVFSLFSKHSTNWCNLYTQPMLIKHFEDFTVQNLDQYFKP